MKTRYLQKMLAVMAVIGLACRLQRRWHRIPQPLLTGSNQRARTAVVLRRGANREARAGESQR